MMDQHGQPAPRPSAETSDSLKAERVQLQGADRPAEAGGSRPLQGLPEGWSLVNGRDLVKVFQSRDLAAARYFAEAIRSIAGSLQLPPEVRRRGGQVNIRIPGRSAGPAALERTVARLVEDRWMDG